MVTQRSGGQPVDSVATDLVVRAEQIRLLYRQGTVVPVNLLTALLTSVVVRPVYPSWMLGLWLGLFCFVILARFLLRSRYQSSERNAEAALRWGRFFTLGAFVTGALWGLAGSITQMTADPLYLVFIVFVLGGMMAAGIVGNAAFLPAMYGFMVPVISPMIVALIFGGNASHIVMAAMLASFAPVLAIIGHNVNRSIVENLRLRIEQRILSDKLRSSEAAMAEAQAIAHVGSWEEDPHAENVVWSAESCRIFGVDPATFKPSHQEMLARVHPDDRHMLGKSYAALSPSRNVQEIDYRIVTDDGAIKFVHATAQAVYDAESKPLRIFGVVQDITARKTAENKLHFANILLTTEMEASPDGILVVDANSNVISFNQRFVKMWSIPQAELNAGKDAALLEKVVSAVKDPQAFLARVRHLYANPGETGQDEFETADGRFIERHTVALPATADQEMGRVWFFRDISERKLAEAQALRTARYDGLTGLANRSVYVEALRQAISLAKRTGRSFAVIYLDLDHFKDVNDTLGHPVGDELLKAVAGRLRSNTREADIVARFGGDEFAVVAPDITEPADVAILADKLLKALAEPFALLGNDIHTGASIGIDLYGPEASDAETLLSHADVALYRAKAEGRGSYRFFTDSMDAEVRTRVTLGTELREAIDSDQLVLLYQPQVSTENGRINGLEALVRWHHPRRGVLGPDVFIPVAETIGVVAKLGHWVLWTACRQGKAWLDGGIDPVRIAVNLSALQFKTPRALEKDIVAALTETGLPPGLLELEITETVLMEASREHSGILARLRQLGVTIAIDDFGTGYSSLDYLSRFPVDRIKIAQNFVRNLETTPRNAAIVKATIGLARELSITVIAEGVETPKQVELLKGWGCSEAQGFYFAKPLSEPDVTAMLRTGRTRSQAVVVELGKRPPKIA
jgi:diguanylate cyclase (GGDEF)-like protein/PAS domain S-box-containing protein